MPTQDEALDAWRVARAALPSKIAEIEAADFDFYARAREQILGKIPPAKRKKAPAAPGEWAKWITHLNRLLEMVPDEVRGEIVADISSAISDTYGRRRDARAEVARLAYQVREPIHGGEWRQVYEAWPGRWASQGLGADGYARSAVSTRAAELSDLGYEVRIVREPYLRAHRYLVEILTTEEGAEIAPHQTVWSCEEWEAEVWSQGANPGALRGLGPPTTQPPLRPALRRPVEWIQREAPCVEPEGEV